MDAFVAAVRAGGASAVAAARSAVNSMVASMRASNGSFRSAGASLMAAFAAGVRSRANEAISAARAAVSKIAGLLPGSPADYGPLSGQGYTKIRGQHFSEDLAAGIASEEAAIQRATENLAGMMAFSVPAPSVASSASSVASPVVARQDPIDLDKLASLITSSAAPAAPTINVTTNNPLPESTSVTINRVLQKATVMGWVD